MKAIYCLACGARHDDAPVEGACRACGTTFPAGKAVRFSRGFYFPPGE